MIIKYGFHQLPGNLNIQSDGYFFKGNAEEELLSLKNQWNGKLQMIYLDPPFFTGKKFSFRQRIGEKGLQGSPAFTLSRMAYSDIWESKDQFLTMLRQALSLSHELLSPEGSLFLHLDYRFSAYARLLMDEIFGEENFLNEIVWAYQTGGRTKRYFSRKHDTILFYRKSHLHYFNVEAVGKERGLSKRNNMKKQTDGEGKVFWSIRSNGKEYRYYEDSKVYPNDVWDDVPHLQQKHPERTGYDTQKPESLLERILLSTTRPGDWVGDFFAGSGTTLAVAQKNGRKWIGVDSGDDSTHVCRKRLLGISEEKIFSFHDPLLKPQKIENNKNIRIEIETNGKIKIKLLDYLCEPLSEISSFSDYIDYWSLGYLINGEFVSLQQSYRSTVDTRLKVELTVPDFSMESKIAFYIIDIYGKQSLIYIS